MEKKNIIFNQKINGYKYIIYTYEICGEEYIAIKSTFPMEAPTVDKIEYCEETETFQMTDYVKVKGRIVKVIFNLDLTMRIKGFIYNDLDHSYDMINESDYSKEDGRFAVCVAYDKYRDNLAKRLSQKLDEQEKRYFENNQKMLGLGKRNNQE